MSSRKEPGLTLSDISKIRSIFDTKQWPAMYKSQGATVDNVFDRFCEMLAALNRRQRDLVLRLAESYIWVVWPDYVGHLQTALRAASQLLTPEIKELIIVPLLSQDVANKTGTKSADLVASLIEPVVLPGVPEFSQVSVTTLRTPHLLNTHRDLGADTAPALVLFVDDFIGTGDTAAAAIKNYREDLSCPSDIVSVVSIAAMQRGITCLADMGVIVFTSILQQRSISDLFPKNELNEALDIMMTIENKIKLTDVYRLGYKQSEALITLNKTPNNTLPVFWCPETNGNWGWPAPFPRYQK